MQKIKVGIVGSAGYTGGELLRILWNHPYVNVEFAHSKSNAGKFIHEVHNDLVGECDLKFSASIHQSIDVLFLCMGHGESRKFLSENVFDERIKIIDLSQDFRLHENSSIGGRNFVYGLPELNKSKIVNANNIANPGCFATAIQLALLPVYANKVNTGEVHISATTGSTGAGQSFSETSHFSWRSSNLSVYKPFAHQHLNEIKESLNSLNENGNKELNFIPYRGAFTRGILAAVYFDCELTIAQLKEMYRSYYKLHPFTVIAENEIDLKQTVNTNKCILHIEKFGNKVLVTSIIDNLIKGASGQAVQNMNLIFGLNEETGLKLKSIAF